MPLQQPGAVPLVGEVDQVQVHGERAGQVLGAGDVQAVHPWLGHVRIGLEQDQQLGHVRAARLAQDLFVDGGQQREIAAAGLLDVQGGLDRGALAHFSTVSALRYGPGNTPSMGSRNSTRNDSIIDSRSARKRTVWGYSSCAAKAASSA